VISSLRETNKQNPDRDGISKWYFHYNIRLRADWVAVILALSARLPAWMTDTTEWSAEIGR
jgi:hypothetical protein